MVTEYKALINGEWVGASSKEKFEVINPTNGQVVGVVPIPQLNISILISPAHL
jgi:acyl-CoA reductase-like NAD-dependent aldehyde dehydrogenase